MRLGMGTVLEQSGDGLVEKASGSQLCRISPYPNTARISRGGRGGKTQRQPPFLPLLASTNKFLNLRSIAPYSIFLLHPCQFDF
jgi:hypothetical protein